MHTLGLSFGYHDSSAALISGGRVVAAAAEERFTRQKHDSNFPNYAYRYCLEQAGIGIADVDRVVYHEDPGQKFSRVLCSSLSAFPHTRKEFVNSMQSWLAKKLWTTSLIADKLDIDPGKIETLNHHFSHAVTAFMGAPFDEAAILVVDAVGEWSSTALYKGAWVDGRPKIEKLADVNFPNSLGLVYSAITAYLGLNPNDDECSTMALAAFGRPVYAEELGKIVKMHDDGTYEVDQSYFNFTRFYEGACSDKFLSRFGPPRDHTDKLPFDCLASPADRSVTPAHQHFADMAASVQHVYEACLSQVARGLQRRTGLKKLCIGGGSALNCVANTRLIREGAFDDVYIPPDPGDGGTSIGAALFVDAQKGAPRARVAGYSPYPGKSYDETLDAQMLEHLRPTSFLRFRKNGTVRPRQQLWTHHRFTDEGELLNETARELHQGKIVGWFQGGFEIGPRALGNRSILIRPDDAALAARLSLKAKDRASFRPYALSMTSDDALKILDLAGLGGGLGLNPLKWMQLAVKVRDDIAPRVRAGLHVDLTTRPQVCGAADNPRFHGLLKAFGRLSGLEAVLNTSFNESGYPIVASPVLALVMFARTEMDTLVINNMIVRKRNEA